MRFFVPLAALLALTGAAYAQTSEAPQRAEITIEGVGLTQSVACDGQDVGIYGSGNKVTLTDHCGMVTVHGDGHQVTLQNAFSLVVSGADHTVTADQLTDLSVETSGHVVTATMVPATAPAATVQVDGADQTLNLTLAGRTAIAVNGTQQTVNWSLAADAPEPQITTGGIDNAVNRVD